MIDIVKGKLIKMKNNFKKFNMYLSVIIHFNVRDLYRTGTKKVLAILGHIKFLVFRNVISLYTHTGSTHLTLFTQLIKL